MDEKLRTVIEQWVIKADNDLRIAEKDIMSESPVTDAICFHAQQAVEKYLKVYAISHGIDPLKSHNITILLETCINISADFEKLRGVEYLTDYAVSLRYPDNFYIPEYEEAQEAIKHAHEVKELVLMKIKEES